MTVMQKDMTATLCREAYSRVYPWPVAGRAGIGRDYRREQPAGGPRGARGRSSESLVVDFATLQRVQHHSSMCLVNIR